jgi:hypothetical protein
VKILVLGHYKLERLLRPLVAAAATEIVLWSEVNPGLEVPGVSFRWIPMNRRASSGDIAELLDSVGPDIAIANVFGVGEERLILTYALAADRLGGQGPFRWHPPAFAELCVDKAAFHRAAVSLGLPVPAGDVAANMADVPRIVRSLGGPPVVVKEARAQAREGVHAAPTAASLEAILARGALRFPVVVQRMVAGEEIGIEVLTAGIESCRFPVASTGDMDSRCDPAVRVRSMPRALPQPALSTVEQILDTVEQRLRPHGPWQLDMALAGQDVTILEVNGRLGGLSDLGLGTTGRDAHELLSDLAMGTPLPRPVPAAVAVEIPVTPGLAPPPGSDGVQVSLVSASPTNPFPANSDYWRVLLRSADRAAVGRWVGQLGPAALRAPLSALRTQVDRAFDGLESPPVAPAVIEGRQLSEQ